MDTTTHEANLTNNKQKVNVIGAGVSGLTTALILQRNGFQVKIMAEHFPGDLGLYYASPSAGADWRSKIETTDKLQQKFETVGFETLWKLANVPDTGVKVMPSFDYLGWVPELADGKPWFKDLVPNFKVISKTDLPRGCEYGVAYETVTLNVPKYLHWLLTQFKDHGGVTEKVRLNHIMEAFDPDVNVVVNCTGIQAREFGGVEDKNVFPTRGQTILVWAPLIKRVTTRCTKDGMTNYIIPRENGQAILGSTYQPNDENGEPDAAVIESILENCVELCPELTQGKRIQDLQILGHNVGLRPSRNGGIRVETESQRTEDGRHVIICHNYGHHSSGYQASWGSSEEAFRLVQDAFKHLEQLKLS